MVKRSIHVLNIPDPLLTSPYPFSDPTAIEDWGAWLADELSSNLVEMIRRNTMTGRPTGSEEFIKSLEARTNRNLTPAKRGRKELAN